MESSDSLFTDVKYYIPPSIAQTIKDPVQKALDEYGATQVPIDHATHIITTSLHFEGWQTVPIQVAVVTPRWVERSILLNKLQSTNYYSVDPSNLFSGVVACSADVSNTDREILAAGITALGGQWRDGLVKDVTHMFCLSATSDKYETAMEFQHATAIKVLLPHWFDDVIKLGYACLDTKPYEWPEPSCLNTLVDTSDPEKKFPKVNLDPLKKSLFRTASWDPEQGLPRSAAVNVWHGKRILLSDSFGLSPERIQGLEQFITRGGGNIVKRKQGSTADEIAKVSQCDVYATKFRKGTAFAQAVKEGKLIGTLSWLFHVHATGIISHPRDQLLHYPVPPEGPEEVRKQIISISNYTGDAREYLKKLIHSMGATFTPNMTGKNTLLIAAHKGGVKVQKATMWHMPIVNHIWLEDCFIEWKHVSLTQSKYSTFPPGMDFTTVLGERALPRLEEERAQQEAHDAELGGPDPYPPPPATGTSARDAMEVEKAVSLANDAMEVDVQQTSPAKPSSSLSPRKSNVRVVGLVTPSTARPAAKRLAPAVRDEDEDLRPSGSRIATEGLTSSPLSSPIKSSGQNRRISQSDEEEESPSKGREKSMQTKKSAKGSRRKPATRPDEDVHMEVTELEDEDTELPKAPAKRVRPRPIAKGKQQAAAQPTIEMETTPSSPLSSPKQSSPGPIRTPRHEVSVVVPRLDRALKQTETIVASSAEKKSSRGTISPVKSVTNINIEMSQLTNGTSGRVRRAAATTATQKLHDEVMPDVLNYEQEKKKEGRRSSGNYPHVSPATAEDTGEEEIHARKRKKPVNESEPPEKKRMKRTKLSPSEYEEENDVQSVDDDLSTVTGRTAKGRASGKSAAKTINIMTTQVPLTEKEISALSRLGMKMVTRPQDCTHLLAPKIARTEKFLCAMAHGPFVLNKQWAIDSIAKKMAMPEEDYILEDPENEEKFAFKISNAVKNGKKNKGKLLDKHSFFITTGIRIDHRLLVNVGKACGANIKVQNPKERILQKPNHHIITCEEDRAVWIDFDEDVPLYSTELLLTGALRQEMDWDEPSFLISR